MKLKKLFVIILTAILILPSFGCNNKQVYTNEEVLDMFRAEYATDATFNTFNEFEDASKEYVQDVYYFVLNIEKYATEPCPNYRNEEIVFSYKNGTKDNGDKEQIIYVSDDYVWNRDVPKKLFSGCVVKMGGKPKTTFNYQYIAFPTEDNLSPLVYEHANQESNGKIILIYQNEKIVGIFSYTPPKANDSFYEQLLKDNLIIMGGTALNEN